MKLLSYKSGVDYPQLPLTSPDKTHLVKDVLILLDGENVRLFAWDAMFSVYTKDLISMFIEQNEDSSFGYPLLVEVERINNVFTIYRLIEYVDSKWIVVNKDDIGHLI